jgi:hypothetical protein
MAANPVGSTLETVKNPMIFDALAIIVVGALTWHIAGMELDKAHWIAVGLGFAFIVGLTIGLNYFAAEESPVPSLRPKGVSTRKRTRS